MKQMQNAIGFTKLAFGLLLIKFCWLWELEAAEHLKCSSPLGVESKAIAGIKASSSRAGHGPTEAILYDNKGWCADTNDLSQYIEVDLGIVKIVTGVGTRGHGTKNRWTESYKLQYSFDGSLWFDYKKLYDDQEQIFQGNTDNEHIVVNNLEDNLAAQYIRIYPRAWTDSICLRLEIYGCSADCNSWLGMMYEKNSSAIPDSAITASSMWRNYLTLGPLQARLFKERHQAPKGAGAWIPYKNNAREYLQVDLGRVTQVSGIVTMGRTDGNDYVTNFYIAHSEDGTRWQDVMQAESPKVFPGNANDKHSLKVNKLDPLIYARHVRIRGKSWVGYIAIRAEIIGCKKGGSRDLGMTSQDTVPDSDITASSYYDNGLRPYFARLGIKVSHGAWVPQRSQTNIHQYLQVYLGSRGVPVTGIATQGRWRVNQYLTLFKLEFGNDTATAAWQIHKENGKEKIFSRGSDPDLVERVSLQKIVFAKYIRLRPVSWVSYPALRMEIYGFTGSAPQIFEQSPGNITLYEYQDVTLRCQVTGDGVIAVKWFKGGTLLQNRVSTEETDLLIANLKNTDSGGYSCKASSVHGMDAYSLHLSVHSSKDPYAMCVSPIMINDITRSIDNAVVVNETDDKIIRPEKWYVFNAGTAKQIPEKCVKAGSCGGVVSGWLHHGTPKISDGVVSTTICFSSATKCCDVSTNVLVRRCQGYVVYKFYSGIPPSVGARVCVSKGFDHFNSHRIPRIHTIAAGHALSGFLDAVHVDVSSTMRCTILCINSAGCISFNYSQKGKICELNNSKKSKQPQAYSPREGFSYYEKVISGKDF